MAERMSRGWAPVPRAMFPPCFKLARATVGSYARSQPVSSRKITNTYLRRFASELPIPLTMLEEQDRPRPRVFPLCPLTREPGGGAGECGTVSLTFSAFFFNLFHSSRWWQGGAPEETMIGPIIPIGEGSAR